VIIREAMARDHAAISPLVAAAFGRPDEAAIVDQVRAAGETLVELVAEIDGEIVGHVLFSRMGCQPPMSAAGLGPLAVAPALQGRGIGSELTRRGLDACRELGALVCVVLGAPAFYGRFGFASPEQAIRSPYAHLPAFQALDFDGAALGRLVGIAYPDAFG
jgi:putative acetyltransferase